MPAEAAPAASRRRCPLIGSYWRRRRIGEWLGRFFVSARMYPGTFRRRPSAWKREADGGSGSLVGPWRGLPWVSPWPSDFGERPTRFYLGPTWAAAEVVGATTGAARAAPNLAGASRGPSDFGDRPTALTLGPTWAAAEVVGATTEATRAAPGLAGASRGPSDFGDRPDPSRRYPARVGVEAVEVTADGAATKAMFAVWYRFFVAFKPARWKSTWCASQIGHLRR